MFPVWGERCTVFFRGGSEEPSAAYMSLASYLFFLHDPCDPRAALEFRACFHLEVNFTPKSYITSVGEKTTPHLSSCPRAQRHLGQQEIPLKYHSQPKPRDVCWVFQLVFPTITLLTQPH